MARAYTLGPGGRKLDAGGLRKIRRHTPRKKTAADKAGASAGEDRLTAAQKKALGAEGLEKTKQAASKTKTSEAALRSSKKSGRIDRRQIYDFDGEKISGLRLEAMIEDWNTRVLKRSMTVGEFLDKHEIERETLNAIKRRFPDELNWSARRNPQRVFAPSAIKKAASLIKKYHAEDLSYLDLKQALYDLGIPGSQHKSLEQQLPDGLVISRAASESYQQRRRAYFNAFAEDIEALLDRHSWVVRKQTDLLQLMNNDEAFVEARGSFSYGRLSKLRKQDLKEGDGRIDAIMERVKPAGKQGRRQPTGPRREKTEAPAELQAVPEAKDETLSYREQMLELANSLKGRAPSEKELKSVIAKLEKKLNVNREYRLWRLQMERFKGVIPELARWRVGSKNRYTLRYFARWVESCRLAGPGASHEEVAEIFKKSPEYQTDGRIPDAKLFHQIKENTGLGWRISADARSRYQLARNMLEAIRTGPTDMDLKHILATTAIQPQYNYDQATYFLGTMLKSGQFAKGLSNDWLDQKTLKAVANRTTRYFCGLGQSPDPSFDPAAEPPWMPTDLCDKILATPTLSDAPLLEEALERLDGKLPFEFHNVMMINHRYSDIVPFADAMVRAGMSPANSVFVSTPYPFDEAVDLQLNDLGVPQIKFPPHDSKAFFDSVEAGIRLMLERYDAQEKGFGTGRTIMILDDGGAATKIIREKFKEHAHKFKIVEITSAGERIAKQLKEDENRLPFLYYSSARSMMKKSVASRFYANRVVQRAQTTIDSSHLVPNNKRVVVYGGGPMGRFAGERYKELGYEVSFVEPKEHVRQELIDAGFDPELIYDTKDADKALKNRGTICGMSGFFDVLGPDAVKYIDDNAIVFQGSSKRNEFDMDGIAEASIKKTEIPRDDGLPLKSYTYEFKDGRGTKKLHFLGDGWTINHDGSLHGSPIEDVQLELAIIFENAARAAGEHSWLTGTVRELDIETQEHYVKSHKKDKERRAESR